MQNCSGIYGCKCKVTGKLYVGSSQRWMIRVRDHRHLLNKGQHSNPYLQAAWDKYGAGEFIWVLLEACPEPDLLPREQFWINELNTRAPSGYNLMNPVRQTSP